MAYIYYTTICVEYQGFTCEKMKKKKTERIYSDFRVNVRYQMKYALLKGGIHRNFEEPIYFVRLCYDRPNLENQELQTGDLRKAGRPKTELKNISENY